jgi:hypothetical protein
MGPQRGRPRLRAIQGHGFGRLARSCALAKHFEAALGREGHPIARRNHDGSHSLFALSGSHLVTTDDNRAEVRSLAASLRAYLEWHRDAGTEGFPREGTRAGPQLAFSSEPKPESEPRPKPVGTVAEPLAAVPSGAAAATPTSSPVLHIRLPQLAAEVASCTRCALSSSRTQTVFARGNPEASLCFVGEAPGAEEDAQGLPFVGRAGQLLDRMITAMGLVPERDVYVCNILKCRPPGNRRPEPSETATCIPYLHEQLAW